VVETDPRASAKNGLAVKKTYALGRYVLANDDSFLVDNRLAASVQGRQLQQERQWAAPKATPFQRDRRLQAPNKFLH
jgi:hypothetical protein